MNISCKFITHIRDFYLKGKWKYYEAVEIAKEIGENLRNPKVRKLAPFAFSIPAAIVIQGVMLSIARTEESIESLKAKVEAEIAKDENLLRLKAIEENIKGLFLTIDVIDANINETNEKIAQEVESFLNALEKEYLPRQQVSLSFFRRYRSERDQFLKEKEKAETDLSVNKEKYLKEYENLIAKGYKNLKTLDIVLADVQLHKKLLKIQYELQKVKVEPPKKTKEKEKSGEEEKNTKGPTIQLANRPLIEETLEGKKERLARNKEELNKLEKIIGGLLKDIKDARERGNPHAELLAQGALESAVKDLLKRREIIDGLENEIAELEAEIIPIEERLGKKREELDEKEEELAEKESELTEREKKLEETKQVYDLIHEEIMKKTDEMIEAICDLFGLSEKDRDIIKEKGLDSPEVKEIFAPFITGKENYEKAKPK